MSRKNYKNPVMIFILLLVIAGGLVISMLTVKAASEEKTIASTDELKDVSAPVEEQVVIIYKNQSENNIAELGLTGEDISEATSLSQSVDIVTPGKDQEQQELIERLKNQDAVETVCPNIEFQVDEIEDLPNDPKVTDYPDYYLDLQIDQTWDITNPDAEEVVVAVIDTGLNPKAEDFNGRCYDCINYYNEVSSTTDLNGHGTNVASCIIAAANNGIGLAGSSGLANVKVLPYRAGGKSSSSGNIELSSVVSSIKDIVDNHPEVKVVNMSFGLDMTQDERNGKYKEIVDTLQTNIDKLYEKDMIIVSSAGNTGDNRYNYPASCDHVICVASVDADEQVSSYSAHNETVDLAATGRNVPVAAPNGTYVVKSGTSFSAPIVSGACAFLLNTTGASDDAVTEAILNTADLNGYSEKNDDIGYGILQLKDAFEALAGESDFTVTAEIRQDQDENIELTAVSTGNLTYEFKYHDTVLTSTTGKASLKITESGEQTVSVTGITPCGAEQTEYLTIDVPEQSVVDDTIIQEAMDPLTFTAQQAGSTVTFNWQSGENVKFSIDGGKTWNDYTKGSQITLTSVGSQVAFKGKNVTTDADSHFAMTGKIAASGSVTSLSDEQGTDATVTMQSRCCNAMFEGCAALTTAPKLPAATLSTYCYAWMFKDCTGLTAAPALSAVNLSEHCYEGMFSGCTALTSAPALNAASLSDHCYWAMFRDCSGLVSAPELKATVLAPYCYAWMFDSCTGLTSAPALPATDLSEGCYENMFYSCTKLTAAPELPATNLAVKCYFEMFSDCSGLTTAPALDALTLAAYCYYGMFSGCTALTVAPSLPATTLAEWCYFDMFCGCSKLTAAPSLPATTLAKDCYAYMFSECTALTTPPALPAANLADWCYSGMFFGCTALTTAPDLQATTLAKASCQAMFKNCSSLKWVSVRFTQWDSDATADWLEDVSADGTFYAPAVLETPSRSASTVPENWNIQIITWVAGDVNQDGVLSVADAQLAKKIAMKTAGTDEYTSNGFRLGDLDGNGIITVNEARKIMRAALGEIDLDPVVQP